MDDKVLYECNESELISIALTQGVGRLRRGLSLDTLVAIVSGLELPLEGMLSGSLLTRQRLEATIKAHFEVMRSQLPGCNGRCTKFPCSDGRHSVCYSPNEDSIRP